MVLIRREIVFFYWHQDPSKIKAGEWIRATVVSQQGPMVCLDTGSTVLRVNQSLLRRDQDAWHDVLVPLDTPVISDYIHSSMCAMGVKCHFLELFSHSARLSEACLSMPDLLVAAPLDLTQPDTTQERVWEVLTVAAPRVVAIVPRQRPWRKKQPGESKWQVTQRRRKAEDETRLCIQVASHQVQQKRCFAILHPCNSAFWEHPEIVSFWNQNAATSPRKVWWTMLDF